MEQHNKLPIEKIGKDTIWKPFLVPEKVPFYPMPDRSIYIYIYMFVGS